MAQIRFDFNAGTKGSAVTGPSGVDSGITYDDTHIAHGIMGSKLASPAATTKVMRQALTASKVEIMAYYYLTALPTAADNSTGGDLDLVSASYNPGTEATCAVARINANGLPRLYGNVAGAALWTGTATFPKNAMTAVGLYLEAGSSSTTGKGRMALYADGSQTPLTGSDSGLLTGLNIAAAVGAFSNCRTGKNSGLSYSFDIWIDSLLIKTDADAVGTFLDPHFPSPLVATAGQSNTTTAVVTGGAGTALLYTVTDWGDGTSSAQQSSPTFTHTYANSGTYTPTLKVDQA